MGWAALYRWIISNQVTFDWIYRTASLLLVIFVSAQVLRGRLLSASLGCGQHTRARPAEEDCIFPTSVPSESLSLAELRLKDTPTQVL
jgi:hypothetical protein